ncbi:hypothetical protein PF005_g1233 [Phytophthora fragariae]|uniref:Uncharacterized protein n=2 Tax=Phytophthora TaxID=4783 RepID=A0A6A3FHA7_9STRA|nr:hypothetical protein PF009_g5781 [Phytophthora fragariae]KAE9044980.1 hypothetical protein PR002_g2487 [Phytophthora rubi]KAE9132244.1 hypothetical protein PF010_g3254 [Phytophthora fragariae]KAE9138870.1 hypothetical protein PF007_g1213 [Phytophthora fragariae]KAE9150737.1 hypothetical protein PF006_g4909 [Phytophthora fragariae]
MHDLVVGLLPVEVGEDYDSDAVRRELTECVPRSTSALPPGIANIIRIL